jgi:3-phenylpropionate/trans-cinnamate dioxygenase ferredoxin reductase component
MSGVRKILIIGGGPAGTWAAISAKKQDPGTDVILLTSEYCEPYEKPPLSKGVLTGKARIEDAPIAGPKGVTGHGIVLACNSVCTAINRATKTVVLANGERLPYDAVVIATGSMVRAIPTLPPGMASVHYLRTETHARSLRFALERAKTIAVVGAGLIGLEVASSARELGIDVVVLEVAPRILARVTDEETGARMHAAHGDHGVDIRVNTSITGVETDRDGRIVLTAGGHVIHADLVLVGTGAMPDTRLAAAAGLTLDNGIVVDESCRSSDPAIFAAGDVVRFPGPHGLARLEDWRHAQDQGAVAGRNAAGASETYRPIPSFWSEQYDQYLQGVGWTIPRAQHAVRRPLPDNAMITFDVEGDRLISALAINAQRDIATARRLIERKVPVSAADLADATKPLANLLKTKV